MIKIDNSTQVKIEKIYDRLVEDIGDKFILYSHLNTGEITFVSKGFEAIFGIAKKDIIGKTWHKEINWLPECLDLTKEMV